MDFFVDNVDSQLTFCMLTLLVPGEGRGVDSTTISEFAKFVASRQKRQLPIFPLYIFYFRNFVA
jgi:hypothetical protein